MEEKKSKRLSLVWRLVIFVVAACLLGTGGAFAQRAYRQYKIDKISSGSFFGNSRRGELDNDTVDSHDDAGGVAYEYSEPDKINVSTADYSEIVAAVYPAVVAIECDFEVSTYDFFGREQSYQATGGGSGFLITMSGDKLYIATNNHVVNGAHAIRVTFCDGAVADADIVGVDGNYDLAVICVSLDELSTRTISNLRLVVPGDSSEFGVGSVAIAIGNALGYGQSVTFGYVSAVDCEVTIDDNTMRLLQTDAAINPGNSGGPLIDVYGRVMGINSAKYTSEEVEGMGYSIPISAAVPIINDLIGYVELSEREMGYLGIIGQDVNQTYGNAFSMPVGVYVYDIEEGSPASYSDLRKGDIITAINGRTVATMDELQNRLEHIRAGHEITLTVSTLTDGAYQSRTISVTLSHKPLD